MALTIYGIDGVVPVVDPQAYVHPIAVLIGDVGRARSAGGRCRPRPTAFQIARGPGASAFARPLLTLLVFTLLVFTLLGLSCATSVRAAETLSPFEECAAAIEVAERAEALPPGLLRAIGQVETGRPDPATLSVRAWPWSINAAGIGRMFETKAEAVAAVRGLQAAGIRSIDVGCLQVNLLYHPTAFASLEAAFDPATNAAYAARFLGALHAESQDWPSAAAAYHSRQPIDGDPYRALVLSAWEGAPAETIWRREPAAAILLLRAPFGPRSRTYTPPIPLTDLPLPGHVSSPSVASSGRLVALTSAGPPRSGALAPSGTASHGVRVLRGRADG